MLGSLCFQIVYTNSIALKGNEFAELNAKKSELEKELTALDYEDSTLTSITYVSDKAKELGFVANMSAVLSINTISKSSVAVLTNF